MANSHIQVTDALYDYMQSVSSREHPVLAELRAETATLPAAIMQVTANEGQFLGFLVELTAARRVLEMGTFTGYSALAMALALPPGGHVWTHDISEKYTAIARRFWQKAGVADRITLHLGPARERLRQLIANGEGGTYDMAFIDADKEGYRDYYEAALALLRPGGLIAIDNTLFLGTVLPGYDFDAAGRPGWRPSAEAIKQINAHVHRDERVSLAMVAVGDGITLCRKR